ncbi:hypothetical protein GCM10027034_06590 [Ramlibacter solisilvae]|uniref:Uncharacterized protein n=1 Tax=Ramlibacter tataouinensis TaxID=94132 RepID=A0A127JY81_9BURK|nr:hypothetical protein [Ramlibacter tataouinensis]AMO24940.1 hypothetical protein UC35_21520 [Ramlibacter tataouinensis]
MKRWLAATILALPLLALAGQFQGVQLSEDGTSLRIATSDGQQFEAPKYSDQVGFAKPRISADGSRVGWLALYPNCCTSYPIPLALVVLDQSRRLQSFDGIGISVFAWCFVPDSSSVAYGQGVLHGSDARHFEWRNISDGRLLGAYGSARGDARDIQARKGVPSWVRCVPE